MLHTKDIVVDWAKVGTMMLVSRFLSGASFSDSKWQMGALFTILGFTVYQMSTRHLTPEGLTGTKKLVVDDLNKVGTMLVASHLMGGGSLTDPSWLAGAIATLIGFVIYDIITAKYIQGDKLSYNSKVAGSIDDWAKFGTMFLVSRLVGCESLLDPQWAAGAFNVLIGFTGYNVVTSHAIDRLF
jgi:hypothetical protein